MTIFCQRSLQFFLSVFFFLLFSACARFPDESSGGVLWQSSPQIPVWVSHQLKTSPSLLWFVGKGVSGQSKEIAFSRAKSDAYRKIWEWFSYRKIRVLPAERRSIESIWEHGSPLRAKANFSLVSCHHTVSPTLCDNWFVQRSRHPEKREAWVLVSVEVTFLEKLKKAFLSEDKQLLSRMLLRDQAITESLSRGAALPAILALEKNQSSLSLFHSQTLMSSHRRQQLKRLSQKTFEEIWTIRRSITLSPYKLSKASLIIPVGEKIRIYYNWKLFFRMNGKTYLVKDMPLDLFLDPSRHFPDFPFLFLFPPSGFSEKRTLWPYQSLFLAADIASLEKIRRSPWVEKKCVVTNSAGVSHCVLTHVFVLRHKGRLCVRPFAGGGRSIPNVFKGMISCFPVSFYHRREIHGISLNLNVDRTLHQSFLQKLSEQLQDKGFLIHEGASNRYIGGLHVLSVDSESVGYATLHSESLLFHARFVDQNGTVRWERKIISRGFGFSKEEAEMDSVNRMVARIVRSMDRSVRTYNDPINSSFQGRMIPMRNALMDWVLNR